VNNRSIRESKLCASVMHAIHKELEKGAQLGEGVLHCTIAPKFGVTANKKFAVGALVLYPISNVVKITNIKDKAAPANTLTISQVTFDGCVAPQFLYTKSPNITDDKDKSEADENAESDDEFIAPFWIVADTPDHSAANMHIQPYDSAGVSICRMVNIAEIKVGDELKYFKPHGDKVKYPIPSDEPPAKKAKRT